VYNQVSGQHATNFPVLAERDETAGEGAGRPT